MKQTVTKSPSQKRKEENDKIIQKQEAELKQLKNETKKGAKPSNIFLSIFENIANLITGKSKAGSKLPDTSQKTLPYLQMYHDGLCRVTDNFYSKMVWFDDINYQLASEDTKNSIFSRYCQMLNSFQSDVKLQITFHHTMIDLDELYEAIKIRNRGDILDEVREGYSGYLMEQMTSGQNEFKRNKYITFGVKAATAKEARHRLKSIENEVLKQLKKTLKCNARKVGGKERIALLHELMRDTPKHKLNYDFEKQKKSGLNSKDAIAPSGFDFRYSKMFGVGDRWAKASFFRIDASQIHDSALTDILNLDGSMLLSIQLESLDQEEALKQVKATITDIGSMKVSHNKRANREGYGMDILPPDIQTYEREAEETLESLEKKDERMFLATFTVINIADTKAELESNVQQLDSVARSYGLPISPLSYKQEQGFQSALPFANNTIPIQRGLTTTGVGIFVPFNVNDINMGKGSISYGFNEVSKRMMLINRKNLTNPNGVIVGIPGSGKSMSAKMEMTLVKLMTDDDIFIVDFEGEYRPLVKRLGGELLKLAPTSKHHINPLDINMNYGREDKTDTSISEEEVNPVFFKTDLIQSLFEIILKRKLDAVERSVVDKATMEVYKPYLGNPIPENIPILEDIYNFLQEQPEQEANYVASALYLYVHGTLNYFNHRTNIDVNNSMVCFDIKDLQKELKDMGMLIMQDQVWNRVTQNREKKKSTWYFADEFHLLLRSEQTAAYMVEIWKRFRKWGGIPTAMTQNVKDFMATIDAQNILDNSPFIRILEQSPSDARILADYLDISEEQLEYVFSPAIGGGLARLGTTIIPFINELPEDNILFKYITTKFEQVS